MSAKAIVLVLFACICLAGQSAKTRISGDSTFAVPDLGFRYTPPPGMKDKTSAEGIAVRIHAGTYSRKSAQLILDLSSKDDDTSPEWHQVWIFVFPRAQLPRVSDIAAKEKMNTALAGPHSTPVGKPHGASFAGHDFLASEFEQKEPPLTKHARIFTTICKTQFVSFVLVSNSAQQVSSMEESLRTLDFSAR
jgi:hypothetical protein